MRVSVILYHHCTATDTASAISVLSQVPGFELEYLACAAGPVETDAGVTFFAERALSTVEATDILVLPGSGKPDAALRDSELLAQLARLHERASWTLSVCTGSLLLGQAGLLEGRPATTHWGALSYLPAFGARAVRQRVVVADRLITTAGVSAGIDGALSLVELELGKAARRTVEARLEHQPQPPFDAGAPERAALGVRTRAWLALLSNAHGPSMYSLLWRRFLRGAS